MDDGEIVDVKEQTSQQPQFVHEHAH
jgi:hypothetical protein